jgi:hypothetical protein
MDRNLHETCLKIMKEKVMSEAEVVPDLQPFGGKPNAPYNFKRKLWLLSKPATSTPAWEADDPPP